MERRALLKYAAAIPAAAVPGLLAAKEKKESIQGAGVDNPPASGMRIQRLAWAGIKIEVGTTTVFVDATAGEGDVKLAVNTPSKYALITHAHGDHYDWEALKTVLDKKSLLVCHRSAVPWVDTRDLRMQVKEMYEPVLLSPGIADIVAWPVPAVDGFGLSQVSWVVDGGGKRIIHCGDTLWHGYWWDIGRAYGPFDMAFLPINGARQNNGRYNDTGIPAVLTPQQAVAAAKLLKAKVVCPIHYGRADENYFEVPAPEATFLQEAKNNNITAQVVAQGEWVKWG